jgi:hypothetical protein
MDTCDPPRFAPPAPPPADGSIAYEAQWRPAPIALVPPVEPSRPAKAKSLPRVVIVALVFLAVGLLVTSLAHQVASDPLPAGTSEFVHGHGVAYTPPNGTFTVRFPTTPTVSQQQVPAGNVTLAMTMAQVQHDDYELAAASLILPVSLSGPQTHSLLHDVLAQAATGQGGSVAKEHDVVVSGLDGIELVGHAPDGYSMQFVAVATGNRLYVLGAHSKRATQKLYDALVASFIAT